MDQAGSEGKRDPAGDGRTGPATEPGKLPVEPGYAAPTAPEPLGAGPAEDWSYPAFLKLRAGGTELVIGTTARKEAAKIASCSANSL